MQSTGCVSRLGRLRFAAWFTQRCALLAATTLLSMIGPTARADDQNQINVRLDTISGEVTISGSDFRFSASKSAAMTEPLSLNAYKPYQSVSITYSTLESVGAVKAWVVRDRDSKQIIFKSRARKLDVFGTHLRLGVKPLPAHLVFSPSRDRLDLIAVMDLEEYLKGVVPSEMPSKWPLEALKAQAVAARTYAIFRRNLRSRAGAAYHLESNVMDQVFSIQGEDKASAGHSTGLSNVVRAIDETKGVILQDRLKRAFATYFHADCGGRTEEASSTWNPSSPQLGTAVDEGCPNNPNTRWVAQLSLREIAHKTRRLFGVSPNAQLFEIEPVGRSDSNRVTVLKLRWSTGETSSISGNEFRMAIGAEKIRSTNFNLVRSARGALSAYLFQGIGFGHGVGLCQWGSRNLAMDGKSYAQILKHYYPLAQLARLGGKSLARTDGSEREHHF